jgi:hypothetical protein
MRIKRGIRQKVRIKLETRGRLKPRVVWKKRGFKITGKEVPRVRMNQLLAQIR